MEILKLVVEPFINIFTFIKICQKRMLIFFGSLLTIFNVFLFIIYVPLIHVRFHTWRVESCVVNNNRCYFDGTYLKFRLIRFPWYVLFFIFEAIIFGTQNVALAIIGSLVFIVVSIFLYFRLIYGWTEGFPISRFN